MTRTQPGLLELFSHDLGDLVHLADVLSEGSPSRLVLDEQAPQLRERLELCGMDPARIRTGPIPVGRITAAGSLPRLRSLEQQVGAPTDRIDLALDLDSLDGRPMACLILPGVSAHALPRMRIAALEGVGAMLQRLLHALACGPSLVALPVLRIVEALTEESDPVASPALTGLLRVLAGEPVQAVEATALRIAGMATAGPDALKSREVELTGDALNILQAVGLGRPNVRPRVGHRHDARDDLVVLRGTEELPGPFARVRLIEQDFEVTEDPTDAMLWFRRHLDGERWQRLEAGLADGWVDIASEIIEKSLDVVEHFARMHLLRRRDLPTDEIAEAYELNGYIWWVRTDAHGLDIRRDGGDWVHTPVDPGLTQRDRVVAAVMWFDTDLRSRMHEAAQAWSGRMAQSVQVSPVMAAA